MLPTPENKTVCMYLSGCHSSNIAYHVKLSSCRYTGAAAFSDLGVYALLQGRHQGAFQRIKPKGSPVIAGQVSVVLGLRESESLGLPMMVVNRTSDEG